MCGTFPASTQHIRETAAKTHTWRDVPCSKTRLAALSNFCSVSTAVWHVNSDVGSVLSGHLTPSILFHSVACSGPGTFGASQQRRLMQPSLQPCPAPVPLHSCHLLRPGHQPASHSYLFAQHVRAKSSVLLQTVKLNTEDCLDFGTCAHLPRCFTECQGIGNCHADFTGKIER